MAMRRLVSSPDAVGNLTFQDTEFPTLNASECLIRVKAFSMNRGELRRSQNDLLGTPIGWDVVGVAEQTVQDGSGPPTGTKIVAHPNLPSSLQTSLFISAGISYRACLLSTFPFWRKTTNHWKLNQWQF